MSISSESARDMWEGRLECRLGGWGHDLVGDRGYLWKSAPMSSSKEPRV